jgi:hypothetical protein
MMMILHHMRHGRQDNHATNHVRCIKKPYCMKPCLQILVELMLFSMWELAEVNDMWLSEMPVSVFVPPILPAARHLQYAGFIETRGDKLTDVQPVGTRQLTCVKLKFATRRGCAKHKVTRSSHAISDHA